MARPRKPKTDGEGELSPAAKKAARDNFEKASIVHEDAFVLYSEMDKPTLYALESRLRDMGHKVSQTTLWRWAKKHKWPERMAAMGKLEGLKLLDLELSAESLRILALEGEHFDIVKAIRGLQARTVRVIGGNLTEKAKEQPDPPYFIQMTKFLADLEDVRRRGYQTDVQQGTKIEPDLPAVKKEPETPPKFASINMPVPFSRPAGKK